MFELNVAERMNYVPWRHSPVTKTVDYIAFNTTVLDVGCAQGYLGRELKKKGCNVYGVEIDEPAAECARKDYEVVVLGEIEDKERLPFEDNFFDYIVCLDVLEHLKMPDKVLLKLRRYLKKDTGQIIVSLPNIARVEIRLQLLFGRFSYIDTGPLSKGHLRFFTKSTSKRLLEEAGYKIGKIDYTGFASMVRIFPTLTSYQFLIIARL